MAIGIDWGGTNIKGAVVDGANVRASASVDTRVDAGPAAVLDDIAALVKQLEAKPESVGIAIPGEVRDDGCCWRLPNVPGFEDVNIAGELEKRLGCPVGVENDATAAALAERLYGWGNTYRSFLLVTLGTGIGGGVVLDGHVRRGASGFAGEIGHVMVNSAPDAWECGCGKRGCMEAYAGKAGLLRRYSEFGLIAENVKQIAQAEGEASDAVFQQLGESLGTGLAQINNVLDLDAFVFTGGVSGSFERFEPHLRRALKARAFAPPLAELPLQLSKLGNQAGVIGAAHLPAGSGAGPGHEIQF
ncbi:MAG: ROK family protein [Planctomycetes bacterium]|nr:ROK family protein [Planctomycetota bacterium]